MTVAGERARFRIDDLIELAIVSDDIHADMISVLANMAMAIPHEVHP